MRGSPTRRCQPTRSAASGSSRPAKSTSGSAPAAAAATDEPSTAELTSHRRQAELSDGPDILIDFVHDQKEVHHDDGHASESRYALSFTSGALLAREAAVARTRLPARARLGEGPRPSRGGQPAPGPHAIVRRPAGPRDRSSASRCSPTPRSSSLDDATATERGHLMWAAACRRYDLIGEFAEEVAARAVPHCSPRRSRYEDFDSFIRGKALWHDEARRRSRTRRMQKLRSNVFRMLVEAGLLSERRPHRPGRAVSTRVADVLDRRARRATSASSRRGVA